MEWENCDKIKRSINVDFFGEGCSMEISVLGINGFAPFRADKAVKEAKLMPDFFTDLNLDRILSEMQVRNKEYDLRFLFYSMVDNAQDVRFRQDIYRDMTEKLQKDCLTDFSKAMRSTRARVKLWEETVHAAQKSACFLSAVTEYTDAAAALYQALSKAQPDSFGLQRLCGYLKTLVDDPKMQLCRETAKALNEERQQLSFHLTVTDEKLEIAAGKKQETYFDKLKLLFPEQFEAKGEKALSDAYYLESPFAGETRLGYLETEAIRVYNKLRPEFFEKMAAFEKEYADILHTELYELEEELQFYLSFQNIRYEMEKRGCVFCLPKITDDGSFSVTDGYDMALAWKNMWDGTKTVANSVEYRAGERFLVVTGPNQGGKTTFARSMGQLVYFAMLGLPVPAREAKVPYFSALLTHFSAEESVESGRGKLKEELIRLGPMMKETRKNCFVILNELFTTAATYDAHIMGGRVLRHFGRQDCRGIYVTHISELTKEEGAVSLVAVAEGESHKKRTYRLERREAEGTGYAADIVERHNLDADSVKLRLQKRLCEAETQEGQVKE